MRACRVLLVVCLLCPAAARAADVAVSYAVDEKILKEAVSGTDLLFQLYTDAACTALAHTDVVAIDDVALVSRLKLFKPKGGVKPPKTAELRHVLVGVAPAPVFYLTVTGTGISPVGGACQLQLASIAGELPAPPAACTPDQVASAGICVDKYEASVWSIPPAETATIAKVLNGTATLADLTAAGATQHGCTGSPFNHTAFPSTFNQSTGVHSAPLYAVSIAGVLPSTCISAIASAEVCALSGKRRMKSTEWQAAALGTFDDDTDDGSTTCNTNAPGAGVNAPVNTGSRASCVSTAGAFDMVGNVWEWAETEAYAGSLVRGGAWNSGADAGVFAAVVFFFPFIGADVGFRCAR